VAHRSIGQERFGFAELNISKRIAVVTGASQGLGRGIARALGRAGMTVYITARNEVGLSKTVAEIDAAGGTGIAISCDHREDTEVRAAFDRIGAESGMIDILVNNAAAVYGSDLTGPEPFWEKNVRLVDMIDVGLRSNYVATYHAAPLLLKGRNPLVVHISYYGAVCYFHGPAYGAAKAGTDKMAFDMAHDFSSHGVACVSLWPGFIRTEQIDSIPAEHLPEPMRRLLPEFETPDYTGMVIERLSRDSERMARTGRSLIVAILGKEYGLRDLDGKQPREFLAEFGSPDGRFTIPESEWPVCKAKL
jgi:NAD(P)-dependent dehydrogenase (short-subunit alcohol dehydrogenase family)